VRTKLVVTRLSQSEHTVDEVVSLNIKKYQAKPKPHCGLNGPSGNRKDHTKYDTSQSEPEQWSATDKSKIKSQERVNN
jgi:hypothetical protein